MTSNELREKFLDFFQEKKHKIVPSGSLLPTDQSVLFTTAGMQQFKPYYLGEESPYGKNVASCQKCFRTSDIEEVGDESHLTFLEMLGNFSFGGYFKEEAIKLAYEFLFKELQIPLENAFFTVFEGNNDVSFDKESVLIWKKLGIPEDKIKKCGRTDNFWGPTGEEGPCGPTTEIHINGVEVWNLVFNEYYQDKNKKLTLLAQKGVDTGMGLERLAMVVQGKSNVFETDLFESIIQEIGGEDEKSKRIIADHIKGVVFLCAEGISPSNTDKGYILRRVLRRAMRYGKTLGLRKNFLIILAETAIEIYKNVYSEVSQKKAEILAEIQNEEEKFAKTLESGLKEFQSRIVGLQSKTISGKAVFDLYQNYGFPLELTKELAQEQGLEVDEKEFEEELEKHQEISRAGAKKKFGGHGVKGYTIQNTKYKIQELHTATHLLHAALRKILGQDVRQMGSDITTERLRFDFSFPRKVVESELKEIEDLVNERIKDNLEVKKEEMQYDEAIKSGALAFFREKYPARVNVFSINDFSREICAGPHVNRTGELGQFKITKEESSGAGIRRIKAILLQ